MADLLRIAMPGNGGESFRVEHPLAPGCSLDFHPGFDHRSYFLAAYEPAVSRALMASTRRGDVVFDVGAFVGYYTVLMSTLCGPEGHTYAFEPEPRAYARLQKNLEMNGLTNVTPYQLAVADAPGTAALETNEMVDGSVLVPAGRTTASVGVTSLDHSCYEEATRLPRLVKIDVEGAEARVLQGARRVLAAARPLLIIEIHGREAGVRVAEFLASHQYRSCRLGFEGDIRPGTAIEGGHIGAWPSEQAAAFSTAT